MFKYTITILFFSVSIILNINLYESYAQTYLNVDGNLIPLLIPPYNAVEDTVNDTVSSQTASMAYHPNNP
jgi:hypothetical protein